MLEGVGFGGCVQCWTVCSVGGCVECWRVFSMSEGVGVVGVYGFGGCVKCWRVCVVLEGV